MKAWKLLLTFSIMVLLVSTLAGCLFGGGDGDEAADEAGPDTADAGAPPPGGPGDMGPPPGGPEGPGDMGPLPGPGEAPGPGASPPSAGAPGSTAQALALKHEGNYNQAATEYRNILAADPNNAEAHWGLAWILAEQGNTVEARGEFDKFIELSDDQARISEARAALERM